MSRKLTAEQFQYMEDKVIEFNYLIGNDPDNQDLIPTYKNLCLEEGREYLVADKNDDHVERIDALVDSVFTGFMLNRLHEKERFGSWFDVVTDGNFRDSTFLTAFEAISQDEVFEYTTGLVIALYKESERYDIMGAFKRVSESNFSKAIPKEKVESGEIVIADCIKEVYDSGRYEGVTSEDLGSHYVIKALRDTKENLEYETGKIIKGDSWYRSVEQLGGLEEFIY